MNEEPSSIRPNFKIHASQKVGVPNSVYQTSIYGSLAWPYWTMEFPNRHHVVFY